MKDGTPGKDVLSLLGSPLVLFVPTCVVVEEFSTPVKASDSQREGWRLTDEEIIPQVR